jgi:hypothetical protein
MSRYDILAKRMSVPAAAGDATAVSFSVAARRGNPSYRQFSAYIPTDLYKRLKMRIAEQDLELSVAVEQAIAAWLTDPTKTAE